jgi:hypothetical protein
VLLGLAGAAAIPAAVIAAERYEVMTLLESAAAIPFAFVLSVGAILLGRKARRDVDRTLGRTRGAGLARVGRILGWTGVYLSVTATISVVTYYVLREFAA